MRIRMIYMAAGNSRRFGSNKLFYPIDGKPMYRHVLERLAAICERHSDWEIVLVSQYEELLEQGRPFAHRTVFSPESRDGASWTIKNGLKEADDAEAFVFFTADQPWLGEKTMEGFVCEMEKQHADLGSVCHGETPGNPVWFSENIFLISGHSPEIREEKDPEKASGRDSLVSGSTCRRTGRCGYNFDNNLIVPDGAC